MSVHFGSVEGISIGQIFQNRRDLSDAGIHAPLQAGYGVVQKMEHVLSSCPVVMRMI